MSQHRRRSSAKRFDLSYLTEAPAGQSTNQSMAESHHQLTTDGSIDVTLDDAYLLLDLPATSSNRMIANTSKLRETAYDKSKQASEDEEDDIVDIEEDFDNDTIMTDSVGKTGLHTASLESHSRAADADIVFAARMLLQTSSQGVSRDSGSAHHFPNESMFYHTAQSYPTHNRWDSNQSVDNRSSVYAPVFPCSNQNAIGYSQSYGGPMTDSLDQPEDIIGLSQSVASSTSAAAAAFRMMYMDEEKEDDEEEEIRIERQQQNDFLMALKNRRASSASFTMQHLGGTSNASSLPNSYASIPIQRSVRGSHNSSASSTRRSSVSGHFNVASSLSDKNGRSSRKNKLVHDDDEWSSAKHQSPSRISKKQLPPNHSVLYSSVPSSSNMMLGNTTSHLSALLSSGRPSKVLEEINPDLKSIASSGNSDATGSNAVIGPPVRTCSYCAATTTPLWRHGPPGYPDLCNKVRQSKSVCKFQVLMMFVLVRSEIHERKNPKESCL